MFTEAQEAELRQMHKRYQEAVKAHFTHSDPISFEELVKDVLKGSREDETDFYSLIKNVLEAQIYTAETPLADMIEHAEQDYPRRYAEMSKEQQYICDEYRLSYEEHQRRFPYPEIPDEEL